MVNITFFVQVALAASSMVSADGLNARAKARGRYLGTAINPSVMSDSQANPIASNGQDFGSYTCENEMKFDALQPSRGTFNYGNADRIVAQAKANGMNMRCHALIWHSQVPAWVSNGNFDRTTMISILETHIRNVVTHFKGSCYAWDVVNEALNEDRTYHTTDSVWYRTTGVDYIPLAFNAARAADPGAKLYYNDYNCDRPGRKATWGAEPDPQAAQASFTSRPDWATVVQACLAVARCVGITGWGFTDAYTWIGGGNPLIWDANYQKKPAYNAILTAWGSSSGTPPTTPLTTPPPSGNCSPLYGQCGGQGYTGSTCCSQGTCRAQNQWYS
ncbi:hypothetical protein D7B24_009420 [Verticillium nonalfalfae]|uniref:Beta-xylanase n=1 Tax=Verticillium nonalfalfae TaxID=1051616 RepID=A0A3M9Y3E2_9PEZI|nr:uncharacterized protein D7B24_009420 [Verticillium nonalfalfae]RNJ54804.1 hypothetical protein D7B24_009420 [Verticillium nonalfalfae]